MARHIGIVGCSIDGAALCYRMLCLGAAASDGSCPEISVHNMPWPDYLQHIRHADWHATAGLMLASARKLVRAGAEILICPDNTIHEAFDLVVSKSPGQWLHIAEVVLGEAVARGYRRVGLLGTKQLMNGPVYRQVAARCGINLEVPNSEEQDEVDRIIFDELNRNVFSDVSRRYLYRQIDILKEQGCDAVILGCTELPLMVEADRASLPTLDSTRLLAMAALEESRHPRWERLARPHLFLWGNAFRGRARDDEELKSSL